MQGCPRCNGTGHEPPIVTWADTCVLCRGDGVVELTAKPKRLCTTPYCMNIANPWNFGGMCDGCVFDLAGYGGAR